MSYVYQSQLKPVNSLELPTFSIIVDLAGKSFPYKWDSGTLYSGYWRRLIIRNFSASEPILYRTDSNASYDAVPPNAEREISGWGSLIEISGTDDTNGLLDIEIVRFGDAFRQ